MVDTNFDQKPDMLYLRYQSPGQFQVELTYILRGSTPGTRSSHLVETINVTSLASGNLDFHLFQYTDVDLHGTAGDDMADHINANTIRQTHLSGSFAETTVTPPADHWQIAPWSGIIDALNDGNPMTLADTLNTVGPADVAWAFQWDRTLTPSGLGSVFQISEDISVLNTPEPVTAVLLAVGALGIRRRRQ